MMKLSLSQSIAVAVQGLSRGIADLKLALLPSLDSGRGRGTGHPPSWEGRGGDRTG